MAISNVTSSPIRLVRRGDPPGVLVNRDLATQLYIGPDIGIADANQNSYSIVDPLVGIPFDGTADVYGASAGTPIVVDYIENAHNWTPSPIQVAEQIALSGTFLFTNDVLLADGAATNINASSQLQIFNGAVDQPSYLLAIDGLVTATPTTPFYEVIFFWRTNNILVDFQHWTVLATNVSPANSNGLAIISGPTRGQHLAVLVKNYDVNAIDIDYTLFQSSRDSGKKHMGYQVSNNISGTYTYQGLVCSTPNSEPSSLVLGNSPGIAVATGGNQPRFNALWAGDVDFECTFTPTIITNTVNAAVTLTAVDPNYTGSGVLTPLQPVLINAPITPSAAGPVSFNQRLSLPRLPTIVNFINNSATVAYNVSYNLEGVENVS